MPLILNEVPIYSAAMSAIPYSEGREHLYKFTAAFNNEQVNMSIRDGNTLLVPRETVLPPLPKDDYRILRPSAAIDCTFTPRNDEQMPLGLKSIELILSGHNHTVCAPTGWGKTVVGSFVAARVGQPTLIVVTKEDLVSQWRKALIDVLKIDPKLVGHVQQDVCDWKGRQFVIGMVQSLIIPGRYPDEMYKHFGMLLLDESHMMAAPSFVRICQMVPARYRIAYSATPKRSDGKSALLDAHVGPVMVQGTIVPMKPKVIVRKSGWKIPMQTRKVKGEWVTEKLTHSPGRMIFVTKAMAKDPVRNAELIAFTVQAWKAGRHVVVMAELIDDHLKPLFHQLVKAGIPGNEMGYYVGGMSKLQIAESLKNRLILATYKMCDTGTDVPQWDTLVFATPRAKVKQAIGRVMRFMLGKKQPLIFDLVDADKIFQNFHMSRLKEYYSVGAEIVHMG